MPDVSVLHGSAMDEESIETFLLEQGVGVLALADGNDAYAVPISFGYDGEDYLYFDLLQFGDDSHKLTVLAETDTACFLTYETRSQLDWRSVIVLGDVEPVPDTETETMDDVMADNAWYPSLIPADGPLTHVGRYRMDVDGATGRQGEQRQ